MKCPFQTVETTKNFSFSNSTVKTVEFADCIEDDCPFFGETVMEHQAMGGFKAVKYPRCRRAKEGR